MSQDAKISVEEGKRTWRDVFRKYEPGITDEKIDYILWNETCYPFDDETTLKQIAKWYQSHSEGDKQK